MPSRTPLPDVLIRTAWSSTLHCGCPDPPRGLVRTAERTTNTELKHLLRLQVPSRKNLVLARDTLTRARKHTTAVVCAFFVCCLFRLEEELVYLYTHAQNAVSLVCLELRLASNYLESRRYERKHLTFKISISLQGPGGAEGSSGSSEGRGLRPHATKHACT